MNADMYFWNYMVYFWNHMVDNHVILKFHNCKISVFDVSRITWCISGITWYSTMLFRKHKMNIHVFPELHGKFPELHG